MRYNLRQHHTEDNQQYGVTDINSVISFNPLLSDVISLAN
jgi:hypothetical protein